MQSENKSARIIEVIEVRTSTGKGTENDPNRIITEFWSTGGELLAVNDPCLNASEHQISLDQ